MIGIPTITNSTSWLMQTAAITTIALFLGFILANILSRLTHQLLTHAEINRLLSSTGIKTDVESLLAHYTKIAAYTATFLIILSHLNILYHAILTIIIIIALFFMLEIIINLKDIIPNYLAGITLKKKFKEGQHLTIHQHTGIITKKYSTELLIITKEKQTLSIPYVYLRKFY